MKYIEDNDKAQPVKDNTKMEAKTLEILQAIAAIEETIAKVRAEMEEKTAKAKAEKEGLDAKRTAVTKAKAGTQPQLVFI